VENQEAVPKFVLIWGREGGGDLSNRGGVLVTWTKGSAKGRIIVQFQQDSEAKKKLYRHAAAREKGGKKSLNRPRPRKKKVPLNQVREPRGAKKLVKLIQMGKKGKATCPAIPQNRRGKRTICSKRKKELKCPSLIHLREGTRESTSLSYTLWHYWGP